MRVAAAQPDVLLVGSRSALSRAALGAEGFAVEAAETSLGAFALLAERGARLVILGLETIAGREADAVRALKDLPIPPRIILTWPPSAMARRKELERLGADGLLAEPFLPHELVTEVRRMLRAPAERSPPAAAVREAAAAPEPARDVVRDITEISRCAPRLSRLIDLLLVISGRRTGARRLSLMLYDRRSRELVVRKAIGLPEGTTVDTRVPLGRGIAGRAAARGEPILIPDVFESPFRALANRGPYETPSCLAIPLIAGRRLLGVLNLADKETGEPFDENDLRALLPVADQAAQTLRTALRFRRLKALSIIDDLTRLYNRRHFRRMLDREIGGARRHNRPLALAILDLDHFKKFNDTNGHEAGNGALKHVADILSRSFRTTDTVARYGGEEFAVILPEIDAEGAIRVLERLLARVREASIEGCQNLPLRRVTLSGGVALFPTDARSAQDLLEAADRALYAAKDAGRNRVVLAGSPSAQRS